MVNVQLTARNILWYLNAGDLERLRQAVGVETPNDYNAYLGARCHEVEWDNQQEDYVFRCQNDARSLQYINWCTEIEEPTHGIQHNVCGECHFNAMQERDAVWVDNRVENWVEHCKIHSTQMRRRYGGPHSGCTCEEQANEGWRCRQCAFNVQTGLIDVGNDVWHYLYHLFIFKVKRGHTSRWVREYRIEKERHPLGCPYQVSANNRCARTRWQMFGSTNPHPQCTKQCLNCEGIIVDI